MTLPSQTDSNTRTIQSLASLYHGDSLPAMLDLLDTLHSAASDGQIRRFTTLKPSELAVLLQEIIYVAQETLSELEQADSAPAPSRPALVLLPRDNQRAEQGA